MAKTNIPTVNDFTLWQGNAGWPLYSYVMEGINVINKDIAGAELEIKWEGSNLSELTQQIYYENNKQWDQDLLHEFTYKEFIEYFRGLRGS